MSRTVSSLPPSSAQRSDHDVLGTIDSVAYALAIDALDHDGPANPSRISPSVCSQPYMPGVNPVTGPAAGLQAFYDDESSTGPTTSSEPPACYVLAACQPKTAAQPDCTKPIRLRLHATRADPILRVLVYLDGRRLVT